MKILVVGNGGREHALLWKLRRDAPDAELFITGGNGGTDALAQAIPLAPAEMQSLAGWAEQNAIDLTIIGPEAPLAEGIADHFANHGLAVFGPSREAARIESSKAFAKGLMARHGIPTADFRVFESLAEAETYVRALGGPVVVKASGLAAGKGVIVCDNAEEAAAALRETMAEGAFGAAGEQVVVEERMTGEELSVFALTDGENVIAMLPAQDHKRVGEGETGPNTGGMGAYAPVSLATPELMEQVEREILRPTVAAMAEEGYPFRGLLYAGLMLTPTGPRVVEFNCRFGDPETQVVLPLLRSSLLEPMLAIARGQPIAGMTLDWHPGAAATTVLASGGYPGDYRTGVPIRIPPEVDGMEDVVVFHAGTRREADGTLVTSGGRVMAVTAIAPTVSQAAARSREAAETIHYDGRLLRRDIGWREAARGGTDA
ncbi:phosphoribosylamine--glycine ligase [Longimicrobium terrae]|uniref:Phosphoribosylamine--glycine ligase n=1 Tax=Longimicrobium terrae TaxID=1639882 RepID=A0A841GVH8_9BACT|nr:phosphoribosylamine--glycine ligase [Longimicrobium terrae]MBB4634949.1 phosphoribosylamine--glycine ligase [Longimicrobium terrae]MBB6069343.1 phosphoribosylamine--glycine ligase [Longimicrobium terrae]NNC31848.1 phosphoribosylamine--glycine ligase [Longimicrobium terrae]